MRKLFALLPSLLLIGCVTASTPDARVKVYGDPKDPSSVRYVDKQSPGSFIGTGAVKRRGSLDPNHRQ